jgi:hypothetical protein
MYFLLILKFSFSTLADSYVFCDESISLPPELRVDVISIAVGCCTLSLLVFKPRIWKTPPDTTGCFAEAGIGAPLLST